MYPSPTPYNPRSFKLFWKPFVRGFQILCVSHYSTFHANVHISRVIYFYIFSTLHIALRTYTLCGGLWIDKKKSDKNDSPLMLYVSFMGIFGNYVAEFCAHLEPLTMQKHEKEIYQLLNKIDNIFAVKLNYVTNFDVLRRKYIWHTMMFFIASVVVSFSYALFSLPAGNFEKFLFLSSRAVTLTVIRARRCLLAFHINTLSNILFDLQILLKRQQQNSRSNSSDSSSNGNIRHIRDIYSNVWLIRNRLSSCFGWSFIAFLIEFSLDLINSSYWAYVNIFQLKNNNLSKLFPFNIQSSN